MSKTHRRATAALALALLCASAHAQQDRSAEKAARRAQQQQQQVQELQQQVSQAQAAKAKLEQDRAGLEKQLQERAQLVSRASAAQRAAGDKLKALEADKQQLAARVAELERAAEDQRKAAELALAGKDRELEQAAQAGKRKDAERDDWQLRFGQQARMVTECSNKNERLLQVNAELLQRWRDKGLIDTLRQREPVLGLGAVHSFNLAQDYLDKAEAERFVPRIDNR